MKLVMRLLGCLNMTQYIKPIIPRKSFGFSFSLPERDQLSVTKLKYKSKIAMAMGGKVAEELIFGPET